MAAVHQLTLRFDEARKAVRGAAGVFCDALIKKV